MFNFIRSFFSHTYDTIVADFNKAVVRLEDFAKREEAKAEDYLQAHLSLQALEAEARQIATKARKTAANIGKLIA